MTVHQFPRTTSLADLADAMTRAPYTVDELLALPLDQVQQIGPIVSNERVTDLALRIGAIGFALAGPGRIELNAAIEAITRLVHAIDNKGKP